MKKSNALLISIICVLIAAISAVLIMLLTGKFSKPANKPENVTASQVYGENESLPDVTSVNGEASEEIFVPKEFRITNHAGYQITVKEPSINFSGTSDPSAPLICNGKQLAPAETGEFSTDCSLEPGINEIIFEHKGETYTYTVYYEMKLINSVSPENALSAPAGMDIEVSATAIRGAEVSVSLNGSTHSMTAESDVRKGDDETVSSGFTTYTAVITMPASVSSEKKLGKISVTAKYKGKTETVEGGSITVTPKKTIPKPVAAVTEVIKTTAAKKATTAAKTTLTQTEKVTASKKSNLSHKYASTAKPTTTTAKTEMPETQTPQTEAPVSNRLQKYSSSKDYGLGTAQICRVTDDYAEIFPGDNSATYSLPDYTPLLSSTEDYVESTAKFDDETYYILSSGYKIPLSREERLASGNMGKITHVTVKDGYITPANTIKVVSCTSSASKSVIKLDMNKRVPFRAMLTGQTYKSYNGRPVAVSSCNCTGLKFIFSQTLSASGGFSFENSVIKSAKWSTNSSEAETALSLELVSAGKFYGFHFEYDDDGYLVITIKNKPSSLSGYTIMLDPGHGGIDSGASCAVSASGMTNEKNINLSIASKVKDLLEAEGATVIMTRSTDKWVCYADRNAAVRNRQPDMFIAIHCDGSSAASAYGTSAYYYRAYSQPLAKALHDSIVSAYKSSVYSSDSEEFKNGIDRGTSYYAFKVIRVEECPAVLLEYGFVTNTKECQKLQNSAVRDTLAKATVSGIKKYISAN